jgi:hypothetical protein
MTPRCALLLTNAKDPVCFISDPTPSPLENLPQPSLQPGWRAVESVLAHQRATTEHALTANRANFTALDGQSLAR